jgi:hypothetical protein
MITRLGSAGAHAVLDVVAGRNGSGSSFSPLFIALTVVVLCVMGAAVVTRRRR